jgi:hypothetical protein
VDKTTREKKMATGASGKLAVDYEQRVDYADGGRDGRSGLLLRKEIGLVSQAALLGWLP